MNNFFKLFSFGRFLKEDALYILILSVFKLGCIGLVMWVMSYIDQVYLYEKLVKMEDSKSFFYLTILHPY